MAKDKMPDSDLVGIVDSWISDALDYDTSDLSGDRSLAINAFQGKVDFAAEPNKSSVVSHDVADTLNGVLPGLLRVFMASDKMVVYEPRKMGDEEGAKQATDCINYVFMNECDGYRILHNALHDGLLLRNGIVKHWWDNAKEYRVEKLTNVSEEEMHALATDESVEEILEMREYLVGPDGKEIEEDEKKADKADKADEPDEEEQGEYA